MVGSPPIDRVPGMDATGNPSGSWQDTPTALTVDRWNLRVETGRRHPAGDGDPDETIAIVTGAWFGAHTLHQSAIVARGSIPTSNRSAGPVARVTRPRP
jgi:hypothetical protein